MTRTLRILPVLALLLLGACGANGEKSLTPKEAENVARSNYRTIERQSAELEEIQLAKDITTGGESLKLVKVITRKTVCPKSMFEPDPPFETHNLDCYVITDYGNGTAAVVYEHQTTCAEQPSESCVTPIIAVTESTKQAVLKAAERPAK